VSLLIVGSVALDSVHTSRGFRTDAVGGSALYFSWAASLLHPVQVVAVVGDDYPAAALDALAGRGVDVTGIERRAGESFRWSGRYSDDFLERETLDTRLGVFAEFKPQIPESFRDAKYIFLGNIDPELQLNVLDQIRNPSFVVCDTMNFWIDGKRDALLELLGRIDALMVNDGEALQLSGNSNVHRAADWILKHGPRTAVIKQGAYGAFLADAGRMFYVPALPLPEVFDPTGAGDSFAGGFMGHVARMGDLSHDTLRQGMVFGAAMGAFAVERFSIERFAEITLADVTARVREFADLVRFEIGEDEG
jgi:sugar/nucleoside kinase (ribokinase family)